MMVTTDSAPNSVGSMVLTRFVSLLGEMVAVADGEALYLLEFADRPNLEAQLKTVRRRTGGEVLPGTNDLTRRAELQLAEYMAGQRRVIEVPIGYPGTEFQRQVWGALLEIPYGETRSYSEIAAMLQRPTAVRAVGTANGANRLALLLPCHRVLGADGGLTGYAGGLWRKRHLLDLERRSSATACS